MACVHHWLAVARGGRVQAAVPPTHRVFRKRPTVLRVLRYRIVREATVLELKGKRGPRV